MGYSVKYVACVKIFLLLINFLLLCLGLTIIGIGIWLRVDPKMYEPSNYIGVQSYAVAAWIMMFMGLVIVITAFIGCCGAASDNPYLLCSYFVVMSILVALEITCIVLAVSHGFGETLQYYITQQIILHIQQRQFSDTSREFLDFMQVKLRCCGADNFSDYHRYGQEIPVSCGGERTNFITREGCGRVFSRFIDLRAGIIVGLCGLAALFQLSAIIGAISVYCAIRHTDVND